MRLPLHNDHFPFHLIHFILVKVLNPDSYFPQYCLFFPKPGSDEPRGRTTTIVVNDGQFVVLAVELLLGMSFLGGGSFFGLDTTDLLHILLVFLVNFCLCQL
jgi:hypothetical protein